MSVAHAAFRSADHLGRRGVELDLDLVDDGDFQLLPDAT